MKLSFHGAARCVTGSKHLLSLSDGTNILLDCGMFQGMGLKTEELNETFGFDPATISFLLLSHAHIDHSGLIPRLVSKGFKGKIYCTAATRELADILLHDSCDIQAIETLRINKERSPHNLPPYEPLYTCADVEQALLQFETIPYDEPFNLSEKIVVMFTNAGHLPGSASIHLTIEEEDSEKVTVAYSGDVGRYRSALLRPPANFAPADFIIMESTYGNTMHPLSSSAVDPLLKCIKRTCLVKKGKLIIPAFSVGRTQEILYALNQLELEKRLPDLNYFVDSPLSKKATDATKHYLTDYNERLQKILETDDDPFDFKGLKYIETAEESKALAELQGPCVIISASGTADAGRVKKHVFRAVSNREDTILFAGYCQEQSLGGQLLSGSRSVSVFGHVCAVECEIDSIKSMSAHGDSDDLLHFLSCQDAEAVSRVFLVHGEYAVQQAFASKLERKGFKEVTIPALNESYLLEKRTALVEEMAK